MARLFSIIDVFDALTSERPYKKPLAFERTLELLEEGRGSQFDPEILDAFRGIAMRYFSGDIGEMLEADP